MLLSKIIFWRLTIENNQNQIQVLLPSGTLSSNTTVLVNLSNNSSGTDRITVNENLTLGHLGIDPNATGSAEPVFPQEEMVAISSSSDTSANKQAAIQATLASYQAQVEAFKAKGGKNITQLIMTATVEWLCANKGFVRSGGAGKAVVKESDLQVSGIPLPSGGYLFQVTGTAVWG